LSIKQPILLQLFEYHCIKGHTSRWWQHSFTNVIKNYL